MEVTLEYEHDCECPNCKLKFKVTGTTTGDIEPPERDECGF